MEVDEANFRSDLRSVRELVMENCMKEGAESTTAIAADSLVPSLPYAKGSLGTRLCSADASRSAFHKEFSYR